MKKDGISHLLRNYFIESIDPKTSSILDSTVLWTAFLPAPRYALGSNSFGLSPKVFLTAAVKANLKSVSMFILHTAIPEAFLNISTGIPLAPAMSPPYWLQVSTAFGSTAEAPWRTIGKPGNLAWISSNISNLNCGLKSNGNLNAPWDVPIAIANESTPFLLTKSTACSGSVFYSC